MFLQLSNTKQRNVRNSLKPPFWGQLHPEFWWWRIFVQIFLKYQKTIYKTHVGEVHVQWDHIYSMFLQHILHKLFTWSKMQWCMWAPCFVIERSGIKWQLYVLHSKFHALNSGEQERSCPHLGMGEPGTIINPMHAITASCITSLLNIVHQSLTKIHQPQILTLCAFCSSDIFSKC